MNAWLVFCLLLLPVSLWAQPKIVTTFSVLEGIARELAASDLEVANLVPGGSDPHLFEPGPRDFHAVRGVRLLIANGLHFEPWLDKLLRARATEPAVVYATRTIRPRTVKARGLDIADPHAWNAPGELLAYIEVIRDAMVQHFPTYERAIHQRAAFLLARIRSIDHEFAAKFARLPPTGRVMLTTHDAAGYIAKAYNITALAPVGLSTTEDFTAGDLTRLLRQVQRYEVKVIFTEPSHHRVLSEKLAARARLGLGETLYLDGLSAPGGRADTLDKMLRHNLNALWQAMQ